MPRSYTLAVGKAPFHAASKEEIYKKLKAGEYSWPELSSITNDISADLRDLVSTLLVPEELRPCPDKIVAHPFFKIAYVPTKMSRAQVSKAPTWPVQLPSPEILQRGFSDSWWVVCKESGVGEYVPGKCFQLNAGKRIRSIVKDIEREVAAGRQPTIPIPHDTVYTPFASSGSCAPEGPGGLPEIQEEREVAIEGRQLREISNNEVQATTARPVAAISEADGKRKRDAERMPPPAQPRRGLTVRKTRAVAEDASARSEAVQMPINERSSSRGASRTTSTTSTSTASAPTDYVDAQAPAAPTVPKRAADASLARRPRTMRTRTAEKEDVQAVRVPVAEPDPVANGSVRHLNPPRASRSRAKQAVPDVIEILSDEEPDREQCLVLPPAPVMAAKVPVPVPAPSRTRPGSSLVALGTDPATVLHRLTIFRDNLASALDNKHLPDSRRAAPQPAKPLPFVSRWVDYSRKHGVGYVLDDGTVGFIASAGATKAMPVTHVAVRSGERWLRRIGKQFENLEKVPFHILEDQGDAGIARVKSLPTDTKDRERQKMLRVLWVKFGRYMNQSLNGSEDSEAAGDGKSAQEDLQFVRFYQRMANVGIWGFADGCLQVRPAR